MNKIFKNMNNEFTHQAHHTKIFCPHVRVIGILKTDYICITDEVQNTEDSVIPPSCENDIFTKQKLSFTFPPFQPSIKILYMYNW